MNTHVRVICLVFTLFNAGDTPELKDVLKQLLGLASHWKIIGGLLGLESQLLDKIKSDGEGAQECLLSMLSEWLKQVDPPPTWEDIAEAVESVNANKAQEIRKCFIDTIP